MMRTSSIMNQVRTNVMLWLLAQVFLCLSTLAYYSSRLTLYLSIQAMLWAIDQQLEALSSRNLELKQAMDL